MKTCKREHVSCFFFSCIFYIFSDSTVARRSQWPRGLRRRSAASRLLRSWVRIPPGAWMFVCFVLSGRGLCDGLITLPEESYWLCCVVVCDLETSRMRRPAMTRVGSQRHSKKKSIRQTRLNLFINYYYIGIMFRLCRFIIRPSLWTS